MQVKAAVIREGGRVGLQARNVVKVDLLGAHRLGPLPIVHMLERCTLPGVRHIGRFFFEGEIDIVILALATDTKSSGLDAREDDSDQLAKRCWVQRNDSLSTTAGGIL